MAETLFVIDAAALPRSSQHAQLTIATKCSRIIFLLSDLGPVISLQSIVPVLTSVRLGSCTLPKIP